MVSIKDVAKLAGVSTATVSRTLASPDKVSEATRNKVQQAIDKSGYVANTLARNFRRRKTNMVLVLVPDITNTFFAGVIQGIEWVAQRHNYRVLLGDTQYNPEGEKAYAELVAQKQADGIITLGENIPFTYRKGRKTIDPSWPPLAMACEYHTDIPLPTVCIDNEAAAFEAVNHLIEAGHTQIAYINGPADSPICKDRLKGYRKAMNSIGITATKPWIVEGNYSAESGRQSMAALLAANERPTAVFAANDEMAIGAMAEIKAQGFSIPDDISIVGFDDINFAAYCDPPLTTIRQPRHDIGKKVMLSMLSLLNDKSVPEQHVVLPHELVCRGSTAKKN